MQAAIADPLIEDVYRLARINTLVLVNGGAPDANTGGGDEVSANDPAEYSDRGWEALDPPDPYESPVT
jgi:hypothetical protein